MDEYISRKAAIEGLPAEALERNLDSVMTDDAHRYHRAAERVIAGVPAADVVSRDAFNRILAENDDMRAQLAQIGKKPGDSMDDVRRVVLFRDCKHYKIDPLEQINACVKDADEVDGYYSGFMSYPAADWFCADGDGGK